MKTGRDQQSYKVRQCPASLEVETQLPNSQRRTDAPGQFGYPPSLDAPSSRWLLPLRQLLLLLFLVAFQCVGASLFLWCETEAEQRRARDFEAGMVRRRRHMVQRLVQARRQMLQAVMNESALGQEEWMQFCLFHSLLDELVVHDNFILLIAPQQRTMRWDFWNAMLYAQSIFTTVGYGHLFTRTVSGRVCTMFYALVGIPLVLVILDDLGKALTRLLLFPWFLLKCACRRAFRHCTRQSRAEIRALDADDRRELDSADLPLPLAVFALFVWVCFCAVTVCLWERQSEELDLFSALYFVFISLSTIGLGDITPSPQPQHLLLLSACLIVGLALVSLTVSLFQAKLYRLRDKLCSSTGCPSSGTARAPPTSAGSEASCSLARPRGVPLLRRNPKGSSLGVLSTNTSSSRASAGARERLRERARHNKCTQTVFSFPSPGFHNSRVTRAIVRNDDNKGLRLMPVARSLSIDDVMRLVDTEEGDIVLLTELTLSRDDTSGLSAETTAAEESSEWWTMVEEAPRHHREGGDGESTEGETSKSSNRSKSSRTATRATTSSSTTTTTTTSSSSNSSNRKRANGKEEGVVVSRSFDHQIPSTSSNYRRPAVPQYRRQQQQFLSPLALAFPPGVHQQLLLSSLLGHPPANLTDLELLEELEDRMVFSHGGGGEGGASTTTWAEMAPMRPMLPGSLLMLPPQGMGGGDVPRGGGGVHFRSRLSLIPEQRSMDEAEPPEQQEGQPPAAMPQLAMLMRESPVGTTERSLLEATAGEGGEKEASATTLREGEEEDKDVESAEKGTKSWSSGSVSAFLKRAKWMVRSRSATLSMKSPSSSRKE